MKKLQLVSALSFLIALSAQAQQNIVEPIYLIQCQQDPEIVGVGTELNIGFGVSPNEFVATLTRTATTMPPRTSTETFGPLRLIDDGASRVYEGKGFKLTLSSDMIDNPRLGYVSPAIMLTDDTGQDGQNLLCKQAPLGLPGVTGSN